MLLGYGQMVRLSFLIRKIEGSSPSIPEDKYAKQGRYLVKMLFYKKFLVEIY
jgi:hypothetical protein